MSLSQSITRQRKRKTKKTAPHLMIFALAGTGKTTTIVEGVKNLMGFSSSISPSSQQRAIWDAIALSKNPRSVCCVAFSKAIQTELQKRVPPGCTTMTAHSMGFKAITKHFGLKGRNIVNGKRTEEIIAELLNRDIWQLRSKEREMLSATCRLVDLCKMTLTGHIPHEKDWPTSLVSLASHYDVDLGNRLETILDLVPRVLERTKDVQQDGRFDYADMVWLPVVLNLPLFCYDLLFVDEAQDLNRAQQELMLRAGKRLVLCGDPKQAIFGFAGADCESMPRMHRLLSEMPAGCVSLPLTITYRCAKSVVAEAQQFVPDYQAHESNPNGAVQTISFRAYKTSIADGDMLLCRTNAPLVSQCFQFLKEGRKAVIQGQDIGTRLSGLIKRLKPASITDLQEKLDSWLSLETTREGTRPVPNENRIIALQDRHSCIMAFIEDAATPEEVIKRIDKIFTDEETTGIKLSSIHKAKGLEADNVFILDPSLLPYPMARTAWQKEQEYNLYYVAVTRAKHTLTYVGPKKKA